MAFDWYKKMNGFVEIQIEGYFSERLINLALKRGITIWDIRRKPDGRVIAKVVPKEFKKLRPIARQTRCRIKILRKRGIPFLVWRYQKRKIFLLLILVMGIFIYIYNSYVWRVDITGDFDIPIEELRAQLEEENVKVLARKKEISIDQAKINMALKRNDLAWIGISLKGTKAIVEIVEKVMPEVEELSGIPCNIVAKKEGVITRIYAKDGLAVVEKDDWVQAGQVLISGIMTSKQGEERLVHADGEVYAKTWYASKAKVPYQRDVVGKTGNVEKRYQINLGKYEINFLNSDTNFEKYDTITSSNQLKILDRFVLPIEVTEVIYEELEVDTIELSRQQAENIAKNEAMNGAMQMVPQDAENVNNAIVIREYDEGVEAEVTIECIEKIGTKEKLGG
ncbi:MAG: sporulation protein YqfD [Clostridia bacterium]|nr:sporulation protein YqfD [Clostridia bacterium]